MQINHEKLPIPVNVIDEADYVMGFGKKELLISIVAFLLSVVLAILIYLIRGDIIWAIGSGVGLLAITISVVRRDRFNESLIDKLRFVKMYIKDQKHFEYKYHNIHEGESVNAKAGGKNNRQ